MFLRAGFNARNRATGIWAFITHVRGNGSGRRPLELRQWRCGDWFWYGGGFLAWDTCVVIHSLPALDDALCEALLCAWRLDAALPSWPFALEREAASRLPA